MSAQRPTFKERQAGVATILQPPPWHCSMNGWGAGDAASLLLAAMAIVLLVVVLGLGPWHLV